MNRWMIAALVLAPFGCGDDAPPATPTVEESLVAAALTDATCEAFAACACERSDWGTQSACSQAEGLRNSDVQEVAQSAGLTYDGACVARLVELEAELGCVEEAPCRRPCRPYYGELALGADCTRLAITVDVDACGAGLGCIEGVCQPLCPEAVVLAQGQRCMAGIEVLGVCDSGLYCDLTTSQCTSSPGLAQPCPDGRCVSDAYCDRRQDPALCVPLLEAGAVCQVDASCRSGRCSQEICAAVDPAVCLRP